MSKKFTRSEAEIEEALRMRDQSSEEDLIRLLEDAKNSLFIHFKGDKYLLEDVAIDAITDKAVAVYRALYDDNKLYTRPVEQFFDNVVDREDNVTGNLFRFEPVYINSAKK